MKRNSILIAALFAGTLCQAQTFETKYARPLGDVLNDVAKRFDVRLKFNVDTAGLKLDYADFRVLRILWRRRLTISSSLSTSMPSSRRATSIR